MLEIVVNGSRQRVAEGSTILDALRQLDIGIPAICHDPRARPGANCRLCLVRVVGEQDCSTACTRILSPGMRIETHTPELEVFRRTMLRWLAAHCTPYSFAALPEKPLHRWLAHYGIDPARDEASRAADVDDSHPYFRFDPSECIGCLRCLRVCEDLQGQFVWHAVGRGEALHLVVDRGGRLADSSCVACGACAEACPTAALVDKSRLQSGAATQWTRTTCSYCGVGCELHVGVRAGRIVQVLPAPESPVSKGHLCSKGRYAWGFVEAADRVTRPLLRRAGRWHGASWSEALDEVARRILAVRSESGADSIGVLGSARATNEENYLLQKLARVAIGTNNVDCCARVCHTPSAAALKHMLGTGAATNSFDDIERARMILVAGANPTENHPVVGARIRQQVRRGAGLVVIDPRRIELAQHATVHLAPRPGTNIPLLNALAHVIVRDGLCDSEFVAHRVAGFESFEAFIREYPPERAERICGVPAGDIARAAHLYATHRPAMCFHGLGITEHLQGTDGVMALVNLALLTGNLGQDGAGINPLRGQNNVQGAALMGCDPDCLTGGVALRDGRETVESVWGAKLPGTRGMNLPQMIEAAAAGRLKVLYVVGYDILQTLPDVTSVRRALRQLDMLVVQDFVMSETARESADVFLPAATAFEKDGTFMNAERRVQRVRKVLQPPGEVRADARIVADLAVRLGHERGFRFEGAREIWDEIRAVWPAVAGIDNARLDATGVQWPCPTGQHPGTTVLHVDRFTAHRRASLECIAYTATDERADGEFPFLLTTGRDLYQFNAGSMTRRTRSRRLRPHDTLDVSPADAADLRLVPGREVRIVSRYGSAVLPVRIDPRVKRGELFATFHQPRRHVNRVTGDIRDRHVGTPEYKVTAVRLEPATGSRGSPG